MGFGVCFLTVLRYADETNPDCFQLFPSIKLKHREQEKKMAPFRFMAELHLVIIDSACPPFLTIVF